MSQRLLQVQQFIASTPLKSNELRLTTTADPVIIESIGVVTATNVPDDKRQWVYDSYLFCELAANAQVNPNEDPTKWFSTFSHTLSQIAWVVTNFVFSHYKSALSELKIADVVQEVLAGMASEKQKESLHIFTKSLKADDKSNALFQKKSVSNQQCHFCVSLCDTNANQGLCLSLAACYGTFSEVPINFYFTEWNSVDVDLYTAHQTLSIDESIFRTVYPNLKERLAPYSKPGSNTIYHIPVVE